MQAGHGGALLACKVNVYFNLCTENAVCYSHVRPWNDEEKLTGLDDDMKRTLKNAGMVENNKGKISNNQRKK